MHFPECIVWIQDVNREKNIITNLIHDFTNISWEVLFVTYGWGCYVQWIPIYRNEKNERIILLYSWYCVFFCGCMSPALLWLLPLSTLAGSLIALPAAPTYHLGGKQHKKQSTTLKGEKVLLQSMVCVLPCPVELVKPWCIFWNLRVNILFGLKMLLML